MGIFGFGDLTLFDCNLGLEKLTCQGFKSRKVLYIDLRNALPFRL